MTANFEKLREILKEPALITEVGAAFDTQRRNDWDSLSPRDRLVDDLSQALEIEASLEKLFRAKVVDRLIRPVPITPRELAHIAMQQLAGLPLEQLLQDEEVVGAYNRFGPFVLSEINRRRFGEKLLDLGLWTADSENEMQFYVDLGNLWTSKSDFRLRAAAELHVRDGRPQCFQVNACFDAQCSSNAMNGVTSEFRPLLQSLAKTMQLSATPDEMLPGFDPIDFDAFFPRLTYLRNGDAGAILRACLDAYSYGNEAKSDILEVLRNAVLRLMEADRQASPHLVLITSFSAIEALVCKGRMNKTEQIRGYVPTLLQPTSLLRTAKGNILRQFYSLRGKEVHGSTVDISPKAGEAIRRVAAGVVRAIVCWREFRLKMGHTTRRNDFLRHLDSARGDGKKVVGVDVDLSHLLPDRPPE